MHGTIDAISIQAAQDALKDMKLQPEQIFEIKGKPHQEIAPQETHPAWTTEEEQKPLTPDPIFQKPKSARSYAPIVDTLRLYAGWLLAWYALIYGLGSFQHSRPLPFRIPYAEALMLSPLVLSFCFASFLFLLVSTAHKRMQGKLLSGITLYGISVGLFIVYRMNVA